MLLSYFFLPVSAVTLLREFSKIDTSLPPPRHGSNSASFLTIPTHKSSSVSHRLINSEELDCTENIPEFGGKNQLTVKTLQTGIIPPTINYEHPDPECDLNYTPNQAVERKVEVGISDNLGFGGQNSALLFRKFH